MVRNTTMNLCTMTVDRRPWPCPGNSAGHPYSRRGLTATQPDRRRNQCRMRCAHSGPDMVISDFVVGRRGISATMHGFADLRRNSRKPMSGRDGIGRCRGWMEDRAGVPDGSPDHVAEWIRRRPGACHHEGECRNCPLSAERERGGGECRRERGGIPRAEGPRAGSRPAAWCLIVGAGEDPDRPQQADVDRFSGALGARSDVVGRTRSPSCRRQDDPRRQERQKHPESRIYQEAGSREFHVPPRIWAVCRSGWVHIKLRLRARDWIRISAGLVEARVYRRPAERSRT